MSEHKHPWVEGPWEVDVDHNGSVGIYSKTKKTGAIWGWDYSLDCVNNELELIALAPELASAIMEWDQCRCRDCKTGFTCTETGNALADLAQRLRAIGSEPNEQEKP